MHILVGYCSLAVQAKSWRLSIRGGRLSIPVHPQWWLLLPALLPMTPVRDIGLQNAGVLMTMHLAPPPARQSIVTEGVIAAALLRRVMRPSFPMDLLANHLALDALSDVNKTAWDSVRLLTLHPRLSTLRVPWAITDTRHAYLRKLSGLLLSRFNRTVFVDCDVYVIRPTLIHDLLLHALMVADIAMPIDPGRTAALVTGDAHTPWVAPHIGPPMLCSAILAYRRGAEADAMFTGAARRLAHGRHAVHGIRQGDQEMIWFEWTRRRTTARVLALPEEVYCPLEARLRPRSPDWDKSVWWTSWRRGTYPCAAVHGHKYYALVAAQLREELEMNRTSTAGTAEVASVEGLPSA